jgi:hypothetical protein
LKITRSAVFMAVLSAVICLLTSPASYGFDLNTKSAENDWGPNHTYQDFPGHKLPTKEAREKFYKESMRQVQEMMKHYNPVTGKLEKGQQYANKPLTGEDLFKIHSRQGCFRKNKGCAGSKQRGQDALNHVRKLGKKDPQNMETYDQLAKQMELTNRQRKAPRPKKVYLLLPINGVEKYGQLYKSLVSLWKSDLEKTWDVYVWIMCSSVLEGVKYVSQRSEKVATAFGPKMELPIKPVHGTDIEASVNMSRLPAIVFQVDGKKPECIYGPKNAAAAYQAAKAKGVI